MHEQTAAIRDKLRELREESARLKAKRDQDIVALAEKPGDRSLTKALAEMTSAIAALEDEAAAYESALRHAEKRDEANRRAAEMEHRRAQIENAVRFAAIVNGLNPQIAKLQTELDTLVQQRDEAREGCRKAALSVVTRASCAGQQHVYASRILGVGDLARRLGADDLRRALEDEIVRDTPPDDVDVDVLAPYPSRVSQGDDCYPLRISRAAV